MFVTGFIVVLVGLILFIAWIGDEIDSARYRKIAEKYNEKSRLEVLRQRELEKELQRQQLLIRQEVQKQKQIYRANLLRAYYNQVHDEELAEILVSLEELFMSISSSTAHLPQWVQRDWVQRDKENCKEWGEISYYKKIKQDEIRKGIENSEYLSQIKEKGLFSRFGRFLFFTDNSTFISAFKQFIFTTSFFQNCLESDKYNEASVIVNIFLKIIKSKNNDRMIPVELKKYFEENPFFWWQSLQNIKAYEIFEVLCNYFYIRKAKQNIPSAVEPFSQMLSLMRILDADGYERVYQSGDQCAEYFLNQKDHLSQTIGEQMKAEIRKYKDATEKHYKYSAEKRDHWNKKNKYHEFF